MEMVTERTIDWQFGRFLDCFLILFLILIGRSVDWLIGRLVDWKIGGLEDWWIGRLVD